MILIYHWDDAMAFVIRRKDVPVYEGAKTFWQTVAHRKTAKEARENMAALRKFSKTGTRFWYGEEKEFNQGERNDNPRETKKRI